LGGGLDGLLRLGFYSSEDYASENLVVEMWQFVVDCGMFVVFGWHGFECYQIVVSG
jgi:hypothetical protein